MNKNKTLKAIVMLLVMVVLCGIAFTSKAATADPKTFTVTSASGKAGETVKVEVKTTADTKVTNGGLLVEWDTAKLELKAGKPNTDFIEADYANYNEARKAYMVAFAYTSEKTIPAGTVLLTLDLQIKNGVVGNVPVSLSFEGDALTKVATSNVTVVVPATKVVLSEEALIIENGKTETLTATVAPTNSTEKVVWKSSDEKVATVKDGKVTAVGGGFATITATAGKAEATCEVMVPNPIKGLEAPAEITIKVGEKIPVDLKPVTTIPGSVTNVVQSPTWVSSNGDVAKIDLVDGKDMLVGLKIGTTTITYEVKDDENHVFTATTKVTVVKADEPKKDDNKSVGHKMGDMNIVMYVVVAVVSLGAVATVAVLRKRNLNK